MRKAQQIQISLISAYRSCFQYISPLPSLSNSWNSQFSSYTRLPLYITKWEKSLFILDITYRTELNQRTWVGFPNVQNRKFFQARSEGGDEPEEYIFRNDKKKLAKRKLQFHLTCPSSWESVPDQHWEEKGWVLLVHLLEPGFTVLWYRFYLGYGREIVSDTNHNTAQFRNWLNCDSLC